VLPNSDAYRRQAEECRQKAALVSSEHDRNKWLKLAQQWEWMAEEARGRHVAQQAQQPQAKKPSNEDDKRDHLKSLQPEP
jgi:hypothetical protein